MVSAMSSFRCRPASAVTIAALERGMPSPSSARTSGVTRASTKRRLSPARRPADEHVHRVVGVVRHQVAGPGRKGDEAPASPLGPAAAFALNPAPPSFAISRLRRSRGVVRVSRMAGGRIDPPVPPARDAPARSPPCGTDDHHVARSDGEPGRQTFWHGHQALLLVLLGADLATPRGCGQRRAVHGRALCAVSRRQQTAFFPELISTDISVRYCDG
jgi:hypothetical protein